MRGSKNASSSAHQKPQRSVFASLLVLTCRAIASARTLEPSTSVRARRDHVNHSPASALLTLANSSAIITILPHALSCMSSLTHAVNVNIRIFCCWSRFPSIHCVKTETQPVRISFSHSGTRLDIVRWGLHHQGSTRWGLHHQAPSSS